MSSTKQHAAMKVARAVRDQDQAQIAEARQELAMANIEAAIERALANSTKLTPANLKRLSGLLAAFEMTPVSKLGRAQPTQADLMAARRWRRMHPNDRVPGSSNRPDDYESEPGR